MANVSFKIILSYNFISHAYLRETISKKELKNHISLLYLIRCWKCYNNYVGKANRPPYERDFDTHLPTIIFCNGHWKLII